MKITNVSCTQFAGIRNRNISFTDGINIIYGKNESGKSTVVNLISRTLFQNAKLDRRKDSEFFDLYFPAMAKSGIAGDCIDGSVTIENENGSFTVSKEWGVDARSKLITPDGIIRDQSTIDDILNDILIYGEGVYAQMLLSSQKNTNTALQTILEITNKPTGKQDIANAVSQAFSEADGISVSDIEQAITEKINEIAGKHWDFDREAPARKASGGRHMKEKGKILDAYYFLEDVREALNEISRLENEADRTAGNFKTKDSAVAIAEDAYNSFNTFSSRLAVRSERIKAIDRLKAELLEITDILSVWPQLLESLEKAKALRTEKLNRELLDKYLIAKSIKEAIAAISDSIPQENPSDDEIMLLKSAFRSIASLENKLCGMNITAGIKMLGGNSISIASLRTGESIDVSQGLAAITEAVRITVPGVMEMDLAPADVDVSYTEEKIKENKAIVDEIFRKYNVTSVEELESLAREIATLKTKADAEKGKLSMLLGGASFEDLENAVNAITEAVRSKDEIEKDIFAVCKSPDAASFITSRETTVQSYVAKYGSINELKAKAFDIDTELKKAQESVSGTEDIPPEYLGISDPDRYLKGLQDDLRLKQSLREAALTEKTAAAERLDRFKEEHPEICREALEKAERSFEEAKSLLNHWLHIEKVFREQKQNIRDNPMEDIADRFTYNLGIISDGKVSSEFPEADKLNIKIYSSDRLLDYGKLSEGTKETVSLAFRLAVLDHLFPDGGGVIVFDDPFLDMDAERTSKACTLLEDCATRHQVIFLTCKENYPDITAKNRITF